MDYHPSDFYTAFVAAIVVAVAAAVAECACTVYAVATELVAAGVAVAVAAVVAATLFAGFHVVVAVSSYSRTNPATCYTSSWEDIEKEDMKNEQKLKSDRDR